MTKPFHQGFTLIEILITLGIVAVVVAFAMPSYLEHVKASRRSDAQAGLMDLYTKIEHYYAKYNTYANAGSTKVNDLLLHPMSELSPPCAAGSAPSPQQYYCLSISEATPTSFTLMATPRPGGDQINDTKCAAFTLNSLGAKGYLGSALNVHDCWRE